MKAPCWSWAVILMASLMPRAQADTLDDLARDFWSWRAVEMPVSTDDIPRLDRPSNWVPDWSPTAVEFYRRQVSVFEKRWKAIDAGRWPVARQVDYRLIGSAIARARWELDYNCSWKKNPNFYIDQTLGAYFHLLLVPPPFSEARGAQIVATLNAFPKTLGDAHKNLKEPLAPFAQLALDQLKDVRPRLVDSIAALKPLLDASAQKQIDGAAAAAARALEDYREWLSGQIPSMSSQTAIGRDGYIYFLKNVALLPYSPQQLLEIGRVEWGRSVAFQTYEEHRNLGLPELSMVASLEGEIARVKRDEEEIRKYLGEKRILTVPPWMQHYTWHAMPAYLKPLEGVGEDDDFTGPDRLRDNGVRWADSPGPNLGYFAMFDAKDSRTGIVHEGVPGHYFQLALSWSHPDPNPAPLLRFRSQRGNRLLCRGDDARSGVVR